MNKGRVLPGALFFLSTALLISSCGGGGGNSASSTPVASPKAAFSLGAISFGNETVGVASTGQTVTFTNSGNAALSISGISITGTDAGDFSQTNACGTSLAAGKNCSISVTFDPSATGSRTAALSVADNAANSPQSVALTGKGVAPPPAATVSPTSLDFGNEIVGVTSAGQTITLTNSGQGTLDISGIAVTGTNAGDFLQTNVCGTSLAAGASCTIAVMFTPTASGTRTASLSVADNAAGSPQTVGLSGTGVSPTVTGVAVSCTPAIVQVGKLAQCLATVTGTGSFSTAVSWSVDNGTIDSSGLYTAPSSQTTATVKATSTQDATKSGTFSIVVAGRAEPTGSWQPSAPFGGRITALASDPAYQTFFAGAYVGNVGGVWKSTDSGSTWTHIVTSKDIFFTPISDFWVAAGGQTVYALGGQTFFKSTDGGVNWSEVKIFSANYYTPEAMAVDPQSNGQTIYVSAPTQGLFKSSDGGQTWAPIPSSPISGYTGVHNPLALDPLHEGTVFYGTDHGLYMSKDGGSTWAASTSGFQSIDTWVYDVEFDPIDQDAIFVLAAQPGEAASNLYESTDGGNSWVLLSTLLDSFRMIPDPNVPTTLWLTGMIHHAVYKSTDGGHTFLPSDTGMQLLSTPTAPATIATNGMILPLPGSSFLATDGPAGVYKSNDGGQSWSPSSTGISAYNGRTIAVDPGDPNTIYFGALNMEGLYKSGDGGTTWTDVFPDGAVHAIAVDPFHSSHVLAADLDYGLMESLDGGGTWQTVTTLPPPPNGGHGFINGIVFDPATEGTIYISTEQAGAGVMKSTDDGASYSLTGFTADATSPVVVDPSNSSVLFVGTGNGLFKSTDGGATWTQKFFGADVNSISIDTRTSPVTIYAGGAPYGGQPASLEKSSDLGESWTTIPNPPATTPVVVDPSTANSIFVLNDWSPDGGNTWVPLASGVEALGSTAFLALGTSNYDDGLGEAIATASPQTLFIVSFVSGLWRFSIGP